MEIKTNQFILFLKVALLILAGVFFLIVGGCGSTQDLKLRDLEFTILGEEMIPEELADSIAKQKEGPFEFVYADQENLYICVGYGKQERGGYSIVVNELYLTEGNICVDTKLLGPDAAEKSKNRPSYPYIVIKTEYSDKTVIFQ